MLLTPPLYLRAPTPIPPPNCASILRGHSRDRHSPGVSHQFWTIRIVYHQKCCNNAIDRNRLLAPISLQRWASLLSSRRRSQALVPVTATTSRGLGESRTWSIRLRASDDHQLLPLQNSLSPPIHHIITCISAKSKGWQFITSSILRLFPLHVFIPSVRPPSSFCPCDPLLFGVYWLSILPQIVALFYARFSIHHQCVYAASFCCITPPLSFPPNGLTITLDRPVPIKFVHVCTNITGNPTFSCGLGVSPCCLLLFSRSLFCSHLQSSLTVAVLYRLVRCSRVGRNRCISMHP